MLVLIYVVRKIKCQILISAFEGNFNLISKVVIVFKQNIFQTTALVLVFTNNIAEIPSCNSCQNMETVQNAHFCKWM